MNQQPNTHQETTDPRVLIAAHCAEAGAVLTTLGKMMAQARLTEPAWVNTWNALTERLGVIHTEVSELRLPAEYQPAQRSIRRALQKSREATNLLTEIANAYPKPLPSGDINRVQRLFDTGTLFTNRAMDHLTRISG